MGDTGLGGGIIVDPLGKVLKSADQRNPIVCQEINLDFVIAHKNWNAEQLENLAKKCGNDVSIEAVDGEELAKITSWVENKTAKEFAQEFYVELLPDYLSRARKLRKKSLEEHQAE